MEAARNRRVLVQFGLWLFAIPMFGLITVLNSSSTGDPVQLSWLLIATPIALGAGFVFLL